MKINQELSANINEDNFFKSLHNHILRPLAKHTIRTIALTLPVPTKSMRVSLHAPTQ